MLTNIHSYIYIYSTYSTADVLIDKSVVHVILWSENVTFRSRFASEVVLQVLHVYVTLKALALYTTYVAVPVPHGGDSVLMENTQ